MKRQSGLTLTELVELVLYALIIWVIIHFIRKYW